MFYGSCSPGDHFRFPRCAFLTHLWLDKETPRVIVALYRLVKSISFRGIFPERADHTIFCVLCIASRTFRRILKSSGRKVPNSLSSILGLLSQARRSKKNCSENIKENHCVLKAEKGSSSSLARFLSS